MIYSKDDMAKAIETARFLAAKYQEVHAKIPKPEQFAQEVEAYAKDGIWPNGVLIGQLVVNRGKLLDSWDWIQTCMRNPYDDSEWEELRKEKLKIEDELSALSKELNELRKKVLDKKP